MGIWVVAAAAGVGYVAQHCKKIIKGRQGLHNSSCGNPTFVRPASPLIRQQVQDKKCSPCDTVYERNPVSSGRELDLEDTSVAEMGSIRRFNDENDYSSCSTCSNSNLLHGFGSNDDDVQGDEEGGRVPVHIDERDGDLRFQTSTREMCVSYGFMRKKSSLRSRRTNTIKALSSLESCLMAQWYKELAEMEDYAFNSTVSPCTPIVRPLVVTDGSRIISRAASHPFSLPNAQNKTNTNTCLQEKTTILGVPPLPRVGLKEFQRKANSRTRIERGGKLSKYSKMTNGKHQLFQGSSWGALLFCLGISFGIISSFLSNKQEVERLNESLKQTENLVQDLQEELEMKDSLTVKELAVEDYESQDTQNEGFSNGPQHEFSHQEKEDAYHTEHYDQNSEEKSFSKIEAELEAELERLELNMNSCSLEKFSNRAELDADYEPNVVVKGELKADVLCRTGGLQPYADRDGSGSSTTHSAKYAVSPRELSLLLHEVIRSRLEQRVEELETALQNSQMKVRYMESRHRSFWREFSNSESASSSIQGSPVGKQQNHADQPVVINLSGDALDAYNEAYDELTRMNELEEEDTPSVVNENLKEESLQTFEQNTCWLHNGALSGNSPQKSLTDERSKQKGREKCTLSNDTIISVDDGDNDYDEMEELLIKHIVEKARKGSPVVLNAQRVLFSPDENDHGQKTADID